LGKVENKFPLVVESGATVTGGSFDSSAAE
jgi:hypothetical protein